MLIQFQDCVEPMVNVIQLEIDIHKNALLGNDDPLADFGKTSENRWLH